MEADLTVAREVEFAKGWNAGHRALVKARGRAQYALTEIEKDIEEKRAEIVGLLKSKKEIEEGLSEIDTAIGQGGFTPPDGFNVWGEKVETDK